MSYLKEVLLLLLFYCVAHVLIFAYFSWNLANAKAGKGVLLNYFKKQSTRQWKAALQPGESIQLISYGQFEPTQGSWLSKLSDETPLYLLALTDFGRFFIARHDSMSFSATLRSFQIYDRIAVSIDEVRAEEPNIFTGSCYSVTLILPSGRIRLSNVSGSIVDALRR